SCGTQKCAGIAFPDRSACCTWLTLWSLSKRGVDGVIYRKANKVMKYHLRPPAATSSAGQCFPIPPSRRISLGLLVATRASWDCKGYQKLGARCSESHLKCLLHTCPS